MKEIIEKETKLVDIVDTVSNAQQPHVAVVLLLDKSGSMAGDNIKLLNEAVKNFKDDIKSDELARKRVDLAIITFDDGIDTIHDFSSIEKFEPNIMEAEGATSMGNAILKAINLVEERIAIYKDIGTDYYVPWIFMVTDGEPTDMQPGSSLWKDVIEHVHEGEGYYSINWDEIPGNDNEILKKFIKAINQRHKIFDIDWEKKIKIEKIENSIRLSTGESYISLELDNEKSSVLLKTGNRKIKFKAKEKNGRIIISSVRFLFFIVGVDNANMDILKEIANPHRKPAKMKEKKFKDLFQWLSKGLGGVSASKVGDQVSLPPADPWREVPAG